MRCAEAEVGSVCAAAVCGECGRLRAVSDAGAAFLCEEGTAGKQARQEVAGWELCANLTAVL